MFKKMLGRLIYCVGMLILVGAFTVLGPSGSLAESAAALTASFGGAFIALLGVQAMDAFAG